MANDRPIALVRIRPVDTSRGQYRAKVTVKLDGAFHTLYGAEGPDYEGGGWYVFYEGEESLVEFWSTRSYDSPQYTPRELRERQVSRRVSDDLLCDVVTLPDAAKDASATSSARLSALRVLAERVESTRPFRRPLVAGARGSVMYPNRMRVDPIPKEVESPAQRLQAASSQMTPDLVSALVAQQIQPIREMLESRESDLAEMRTENERLQAELNRLRLVETQAAHADEEDDILSVGAGRAQCPKCGRDVSVSGGRLRPHGPMDARCEGSGIEVSGLE